MTEIERRAFMTGTAGTMAALALWPELGSAMTSSAELSVAVIGCGRQGRALLAELQKIEQVRIVGVCDSDERRLASGRRRVRGVEGYADHRALLDATDGSTAIFIATPTHTHKDLAVDCLGAGRHVYCEAPLASTGADCAAIAAAARSSNKVFQTGLLARSNPVYKLARSFFRAGATRDLMTMRAQCFRKTSWAPAASDPARRKLLGWRLDPEVSLGLAGEWGTHQADVFHWFTGRYPVRVSGNGSIRHYDDGRTVPDTVHCQFGFEDGAAMQYQATLGSSFEGRYELLAGSDATIKLSWTHGWMFKEADSPTQGWEVYANRQQFHNDEGITLIADATKLASQGKLKEGVGLPHPELYYGVYDFVKSVLEGADVACGADEGVRATAVGIAAHRAVSSGEMVSIDERTLRGE